MRFTRYTDYAFRVLIYLAVKPDGERATIKEIADRYVISENHLMKVTHRLGQQGFVHTVRGRLGGLELARAPAAINLGDVVRCCEDDLVLVECFDPATNQCRITAACTLTGIIGEPLDAFLTVFDRYTLADLAAPRSQLLRSLSM